MENILGLNIKKENDRKAVKVIEKFDDEGRIVYTSCEGQEHHYGYDDKGNINYEKTPSGYEAWTEYDENNMPIHICDNQGAEKYILNDGGIKAAEKFLANKVWIGEDNFDLIKERINKGDMPIIFADYP